LKTALQQSLDCWVFNKKISLAIRAEYHHCFLLMLCALC
jgi:hypothetical protein